MSEASGGGGGGVHVGHIQCIHYTFEGKAKIINIPSYNNMAAILNFLILLRLFIIQHFKFMLDIILYVYVIHNNP